MTADIDASLFEVDDGSVYFLWLNQKIAKMKDDMSGLDQAPRQWNPSNNGDVGFEGAFLTKIDGRYHLICAGFINLDEKIQT